MRLLELLGVAFLLLVGAAVIASIAADATMLYDASPWLLLAYLIVPAGVALTERRRVRVWLRNRRQLRAARRRP